MTEPTRYYKPCNEACLENQLTTCMYFSIQCDMSSHHLDRYVDEAQDNLMIDAYGKVEYLRVIYAFNASPSPQGHLPES